MRVRTTARLYCVAKKLGSAVGRVVDAVNPELGILVTWCVYVAFLLTMSYVIHSHHNVAVAAQANAEHTQALIERAAK